tara:strand:+ start:410 stop:1459 length:1050 start_codon:yes stop_codon:yes gene_type:complete
MNLNLSRFICTESKPVGVIIIIGSKLTPAFDELIELGPREVVIVEPEPTLFKSIQRKARKYNFINCRPDLIVGQESEVEWHVFNNPRFNSIAKPKEILNTHKNIKLLETKTVEGTKFSEFLEDLNLVESEQNHIVFSVQGAERTIIDSVKSEYLSIFESIIIHCQENSEYDSDLVERIKGFVKVSTFGVAPPELYYFLRCCDDAITPVKDDIEELTHSLKTECEDLKNSVNELQQVNEELAEGIRQKSDEISTERAKKEELTAYFENQINEIKERERQHLQILSQMSKQSTKDRLDLEELRKRYKEKVEQEKELVEFIRNIQGKLLRAEKYYDEIQSDNKQLIERKSDD